MKSKFVFQSTNINLFEISNAESEKLIDQYYLFNEFFENAQQFDSLKTFFIGRTGIGKSAIIHNLIANCKNLKNKSIKTIVINPEDFAFDVFERSEMIKKLTEFGINLSLVYKTIWQSIFISEILKSVYGNERKSVLNKMFLTWGNESKAYKFLEKNNELDGNLSLSDKVTNIIQNMEHSVELGLKLKDIGVKYNGTIPPDIKDKINKQIQKMEIAEIKYFINSLDKNFLKNKKIYICIDDLDKNWFPSEISRDFIGALFDSIINLTNQDDIKIIVSLRTNLFEQINLHQPEKYFQYLQYINWHEEDIIRICKRRINKIFQLENDSGLFKKLFPKKIVSDNNKEFTFEEYLLTRCNLRPRDAIHFLTFIFRECVGKNVVKARDVNNAEEHYSNDRLLALFNEWDNPYRGISFLKDYFSYTQYKLSCSDIFTILDSIFDHVVSNKDKDGFELSWLYTMKFIDLDKADNRNLLDLIFKVGLIGYKKSGDPKIKYSFNSRMNKVSEEITDDLYFYINPCYFRALRTSFYKNN